MCFQIFLLLPGSVELTKCSRYLCFAINGKILQGKNRKFSIFTYKYFRSKPQFYLDYLSLEYPPFYQFKAHAYRLKQITAKLHFIPTWTEWLDFGRWSENKVKKFGPKLLREC